MLGKWTVHLLGLDVTVGGLAKDLAFLGLGFVEDGDGAWVALLDEGDLRDLWDLLH